MAGLIRERTQSVNTAIGCNGLIDILRKSQTDEGKSAAAECLARLAHMKSGIVHEESFVFFFDSRQVLNSIDSNYSIDLFFYSIESV